MGKNIKMYKHVDDVANFDDYSYFGVKDYDPALERSILIGVLSCIAGSVLYFAVKLN